MIFFAIPRDDDSFFETLCETDNNSYRINRILCSVTHHELVVATSFFEDVLFDLMLVRDYGKHYHLQDYCKAWYGYYPDIVIYPFNENPPDNSVHETNAIVTGRTKKTFSLSDDFLLLDNPKEISVSCTISELVQLREALQNYIETAKYAAALPIEVERSLLPDVCPGIILYCEKDDQCGMTNSPSRFRRMVWNYNIVRDRDRVRVQNYLYSRRGELDSAVFCAHPPVLLQKISSDSSFPEEGHIYQYCIDNKPPFFLLVLKNFSEVYNEETSVVVCFYPTNNHAGKIDNSFFTAENALPKPFVLPRSLWEKGYMKHTAYRVDPRDDEYDIGFITKMEFDSFSYYFVDINNEPLDYEPVFAGEQRVENIESFSIQMLLLSI